MGHLVGLTQRFYKVPLDADLSKSNVIIIFFHKGWRFEVHFRVCNKYCFQNKKRKCMDQNK